MQPRIILAICVFVLVTMPLYAQKNEFTLLDNFEDGDTATKLAGNWIAATDRDEGGNSAGQIAIVAGGYRSSKAIQMEYRLGESYRHKDSAEKKSPFVFLALTMKPQFPQSQDISQFQGISFQVKGHGVYTALLVSGSNGGLEIFYQTVVVREKSWKKVDMLFSAFKPFQSPPPPAATGPDLHSVIVIGLGHNNEAAPGQGKFLVDDFGLLGKSSQQPATSEEIEEIRFGNLVIYKPAPWTWESGKETSQLTWKMKATTMTFIGIPMMNKWRIPFSDGLSADPGNTKELLDCTQHELGKLGFRKIKALESSQVQLQNFSAGRFLFSAEFNPKTMEQLSQLGIQSPAAVLQVEFIKYRATTYEIVTFMPAELRQEILPQINRIVYQLGKYK